MKGGKKMANNIFISYDLNSPGQDYSTIIDEIKSLGRWAKVQKSLWYVDTNLSVDEVYDRVSLKMDSNDSLIVIDAKNNNAIWNNLADDVGKLIKDTWSI